VARASRSPLNSVKALPWALLLDAATVINSHWNELKESDRNRLGTLLRKSKGNPSNLTKRERDELRKIAGKLDFPGMARDLIPFARRLGRKR
jgi:hypothetical protein